MAVRLVLSLAVGERARETSLFGEMEGRKTAADANNGMRFRKYKDNDSVKASA